MDISDILLMLKSEGKDIKTALEMLERMRGKPAAPHNVLSKNSEDDDNTAHGDYAPEIITYEIKGKYFDKIKHMMKIGGNPPYWDQDKQVDKFIRQARFMRRFECEYDGYAPKFYSTNPVYAQMSLPQLLKYFAWRTQVRKGIFQSAEISYIYLYINELINDIGAESTHKKMITLIELHNKYGKNSGNCVEFAENDYNARRFDHCLSAWIKDFYLFHLLPYGYDFYENLCPLLKNERDNLPHQIRSDVWSLALAEEGSAHKFTKFAFYNKGDKKIIEQCLIFTLEYLTEQFEAGGLDFKSIFACKSGAIHSMFYGAVYQPKDPDFDERKVELPNLKIYQYSGGVWQRMYIDPSQFKFTKGYILRLIESKMREAMGHKPSLNPGKITNDVRREFMRYRRSWQSVPEENEKTYKHIKSKQFEKQIDAALAAFFSKYHVENGNVVPAAPVEIDFGSLEQIRKDHEETAEKLNTPEETDETNETESQAEQQIPQTPPEPQPEPQTLTDALTAEEIRYLKNMGSAGVNELMIESINEKALAFIGDNLIEITDGVPQVFEEYKKFIHEIY
jgi:hypothetical protein